ncbi:MAG: hypothetical protein IID09_06875 [Candidatus Hydrogenedentes bacterium]|nr:hypothetical protein [Candidatus Hydrogenedentota bacterium]
MSDQPVQNYENHVRNDKLVFAVLGTYLLVISLVVAGIFIHDLLIALAVVVAGAGGILSAVMTRGYSTKLQDRIIRLEMRLRLREVLPDELAADVMDFTLSQLIALRFASDDELPELARKVLDENITKGSEIKKMIRDWQADWHRV